MLTIMNFHVLVPRTPTCAWRFFPPENSFPESAVFLGCGPLSFSVQIEVVVYPKLDSMDDTDYASGVRTLETYAEQFCSIERIQAGHSEEMAWSLCRGVNSFGGTVMCLHIVEKAEKYYFSILYEISPEFYPEFARNGEVERIVNTVRLWAPDE